LYIEENEKNFFRIFPDIVMGSISGPILSPTVFKGPTGKSDYPGIKAAGGGAG
jgi:hypothetical protein